MIFWSESNALSIRPRDIYDETVFFFTGVSDKFKMSEKLQKLSNIARTRWTMQQIVVLTNKKQITLVVLFVYI